MTDVTTLTNSANNTSSGYFDGAGGEGWVFDLFGDNVTYSTNTLESSVSVSAG